MVQASVAEVTKPPADVRRFAGPFRIHNRENGAGPVKMKLVAAYGYPLTVVMNKAWMIAPGETLKINWDDVGAELSRPSAQPRPGLSVTFRIYFESESASEYGSYGSKLYFAEADAMYALKTIELTNRGYIREMDSH